MVKSHHTLHFLTGFMGDPSGHPQSSENSGMLDIGPFTLKLDGEYLPFRTCKIHYIQFGKVNHWQNITRFSSVSGMYTAQCLLAADSQNSWRGV